MATHLWLLRHGEAVPHGTRPDPERELTEKGERQSRLAGRALAALGVEFDACYASPKVRARDTARLAAEALAVDVTCDDVVADDFTRREAEGLAAGHDGHVLVVGHEPDFSQVVYDFTGGRVDFKKGGIAVIALGSAPELVLLARPADLKLMA
ncbi:MAG: phosphohistidine phosphatase [Solirubrobacteraceae bacterium]|nr:phosphohistidine phosphatase [Solirubrobacteraceae bacterium]